MPFDDATRTAPSLLEATRFILRPLRADDAQSDHDAVMETREELRGWEQDGWPDDDFTVEANREDLEGLEQRHREHRAFTFTVRHPESDECLGCVYLFPPSATFLARATVTAREDPRWDEVDVAAYFWVRTSRIASGLEAELVASLRSWLTDEWGFENAVFITASAFTRQRDVLVDAGLAPTFEIVEPEKHDPYLGYFATPAHGTHG